MTLGVSGVGSLLKQRPPQMKLLSGSLKLCEYLEMKRCSGQADKLRVGGGHFSNTVVSQYSLNNTVGRATEGTGFDE